MAIADLSFLTVPDLDAQIINQFLVERSDEDTQEVIENIELQQIEIIKAKLKGRYNITAIFTATGGDRHYLIIKILTTLVVYYFIRRNAARKVPSDYVKEWEWAMKLLEKIKAGKEIPDGLPELTNQDGSAIGVMHGNNSNTDFYI